jgi:predicted HTH domain antitoxin
MTKIKQISEQQISELEDQILDVDTVIQDPDFLDPAIEFITLIDQKIQDMLPSINEDTPDLHIKRLQLCAYTLSKLAEKAESQLGEIKEEILKIKKGKTVNDAYQSNKK